MLDINDIVKIFEEIELRLVQSLKINLGRHRQEEKDYGMNWSAWQAEKLEGLRKFRQENADIMSQYVDQIDTETRKIMAEQFEEGMNGAVPHGADQPQFFGVDTVKVNKLIDDVSYLQKNVETAALRCTDDVYRRTVHRAQLAMSTGSMTLQQAIDMAVKDFLDKGINCIEYRDGRRVNIADYVRMALRTTATRAAIQGKSERFKALGYDTIQVSKYSMCSDTCLPWQGRVYINDVYTMWDGEVRDHGGILWGKSNYCGKWFMLLSAAIEKGLFHPNCRHTILLWRDGDPLPESIDNEENERRYKLEQEQRRLENKVRKAKRKVEGLSDPDNIKKAKAELREAQKQLREFIDKVNADEGETILKRDYGKEKIYEKSAKESPKPLTPEEKKRILKEKIDSGEMKTNVDVTQQPKHQYSKSWKNQVKQSLMPGSKQKPRSVLAKGAVPEELVKKYSLTGRVELSRDGSRIDEFVNTPDFIGRTYDSELKRYVKTKTLQIRYTKKGIHVFPTIKKEA